MLFLYWFVWNTFYFYWYVATRCKYYL